MHCERLGWGMACLICTCVPTGEDKTTYYGAQLVLQLSLGCAVLQGTCVGGSCVLFVPGVARSHVPPELERLDVPTVVSSMYVVVGLIAVDGNIPR